MGDPGDQLCTDDFEGPSPHNANLAAKGVVALAAWASTLNSTGSEALQDDALRYAKAAKTFAKDWTSLALSESESQPLHFKMAFDQEASWSLKYNLLFQYLLSDLEKPFPDEVISMEEDFYACEQMNAYGIPLDNRANFTKLDWSMWIAAMGSEEQFEAITNATFCFANDVTDRVPLSDWTSTTAPTVTGFQA